MSAAIGSFVGDFIGIGFILFLCWFMYDSFR